MNLDYLRKGFRDSIVNDILQVANYHSRQNGNYAGWFSIPRQVFCFIDFLGAVAYNNKNNEDGASTRKAVRFIKEFFPKEYKAYANLLVVIWRNGTVHNFVPSVLYYLQGNRKTILEWTSNCSNSNHNRKVNLKTFNKNGSTDTIYLSINICQLADDLLWSFDNFIQNIDRNISFRNGCLRRLKRTCKMKNCMTLRTGMAQKNELKKQILLAKKSTSGKIVDYLNVEWY